MIPALLLNVIKGLIVDKAQDLAVEHVKSAIGSVLSEDDMKELDKVVDKMEDNGFTNVSDFLKQ